MTSSEDYFSLLFIPIDLAERKRSASERCSEVVRVGGESSESCLSALSEPRRRARLVFATHVLFVLVSFPMKCAMY